MPKASEALGGKGGGRLDMAQAGGPHRAKASVGLSVPEWSRICHS
nr:hypothetical protein [Bradyrhizobium sp. AUGA SZCCT0283]